MQPIFQGDSYDTPPDRPRRLLDRLAFGTRFYFVAGVLGIINQARILCNRQVYNDESWAKSSYAVFQLIEGCGGRFHLRGLENIQSSPGPVVFISNHMSTLETFILPCIIEPLKDVTFVVKDSLVTNPFFGPLMRSRDPIVVSRQRPKEDFKIVMENGQNILSSGRSIIIFPQSTRTTDFMPENFNTLGIKLAKAAGVEVIPVAIKTDFWGNGKWVKDFGPIRRDLPIHMQFGKPLTVKGGGREEHQQIIDFIKSHLDTWNHNYTDQADTI